MYKIPYILYMLFICHNKGKHLLKSA